MCASSSRSSTCGRRARARVEIELRERGARGRRPRGGGRTSSPASSAAVSGRPWVSTQPDHDVDALRLQAPGRLEHRVGLADARARSRRRSSGRPSAGAPSSACTRRSSASGSGRSSAIHRGPPLVMPARAITARRRPPVLFKARLSRSTFTRRLAEEAGQAPLAVRVHQPRTGPRAGRARGRRAAPGRARPQARCAGSSPLPDVVTRSTGIGPALPGSAARSARDPGGDRRPERRVRGPEVRARGRRGPSYGAGDVAEGLPQKFSGPRELLPDERRADRPAVAVDHAAVRRRRERELRERP